MGDVLLRGCVSVAARTRLLFPVTSIDHGKIAAAVIVIVVVIAVVVVNDGINGSR